MKSITNNKIYKYLLNTNISIEPKLIWVKGCPYENYILVSLSFKNPNESKIQHALVFKMPQLKYLSLQNNTGIIEFKKRKFVYSHSK